MATKQTTALITISTRASLKRYHAFTLTLGLGDRGDQWDVQRIGTESEKGSVEKELAELKERLGEVEAWKARRREIDDELNKVWVAANDDDDNEKRQERQELAAPSYISNNQEAVEQ